MTKPSKPRLTAEEAVEQMSAQAIVCRDFSHAWAHWYATRISGGGFERGLRCSTCGAIRTEYLDALGRLVGSRRYDYPDGYTVPGAGRMTSDFRATVRLTSILRSIQGGDGAAPAG
jgi:hypothetical protein